MRTALMWLAGAYIFTSFYSMTTERQGLLRNGRTVYLELAPVDPRSLLQGDYMALNYAVMNRLNHVQPNDPQLQSGDAVGSGIKLPNTTRVV